MCLEPLGSRGALELLLQALQDGLGSQQLWLQLQGQGWQRGLLKSLEVSTTLPAPCLWVVVDRRGSGGCRQDRAAAQLWCVHMLPLGFIFGCPVSIPAADGISQGIPEGTHCSHRNKQTFSLLHVTEGYRHLLALSELRVKGTQHLQLHYQSYGNWGVYYVHWI